MTDTLFHLAYKTETFAIEPLSYDYIFVDAKDGSILAVDLILVNDNGIAETRYRAAHGV